ncbi:MAG: hypothetical protein ACETWG_00805 [Candidatus Neomarinimicrobiota bacterium]
MNELPIPDPSLIALPGPVWLFQALLLAIFILHLLLMNLVLGGSMVSAVHLFRGRSRPGERELALTLAKTLPVAMAMTITFGVPPLLFIQALHGRLFYSSSILTAWPWLTIVVFLVVAYYGFYVLSMKGENWEQYAPWFAVLSAVLLFLVGATFTSNLTLMQTPERYQQAYNSTFLGLYLNLSDPTMVPRFLHIFLAALAVTGAFLALRHRREKPKRNVGLGWFAGATLGQVPVGLWFLFALPEDLTETVLEYSLFGLPYFWIMIAVAALALLHFVGAFFARDKTLPIIEGSALLLVTIVLMAGMRTVLRQAYLEPVYQLDSRVAAQWGPLALFAVTLIIGLVAVGWLIRAYRRSLIRASS